MSDGDQRDEARARLEAYARQEAGPLYTLFRRAIGDAQRARDLLQDTLLDAWRNVERYDRSRPLAAWVFRIGQNRLRNFLRRQELEHAHVRPLGSDHAGGQPGPEVASLRRERHELLEEALLRLPPDQRLATILRYQEAWSCSEIGEALDMTPNAVSIQLHRARRRLRALLEQKLVGGSP
jgi:RNA polymerase sigma-70 factor (ECF subfamily)